MQTDRKRLFQVVLNVVSNGLKYTEHGMVKVTASIKGKQVLITVKDTGIGIEAAGLAKLFKPFERIESHLRIKTLGTGLGLYLTSRISKTHNGSVSIEDNPKGGSIFAMWLTAEA